MYTYYVSIDPRNDRQKDQTTLIEPVDEVVWEWGQDTPYIHQSAPPSVRHTVLYLYWDAHNIHVYAPSRKLIQYSAVATSHNYMLFFKECPIPISSVPISSTSGTS